MEILNCKILSSVILAALTTKPVNTERKCLMPEWFANILGTSKFVFLIVFFLFLTWFAFFIGSPSAAAFAVKALAIVVIIAIGLLVSKAYRRISKR
jgi:hypothetical protein